MSALSIFFVEGVGQAVSKTSKKLGADKNFSEYTVCSSSVLDCNIYHVIALIMIWNDL